MCNDMEVLVILNCHQTRQYRLYSRKILREKTIMNFKVRKPFAKILGDASHMHASRSIWLPMDLQKFSPSKFTAIIWHPSHPTTCH